MFKFLPIAAAFVAASVSPIWAEPSVVVTLRSVPDRIRSQNPDLAAARLRINEAVGRSTQSGRLANPSLETSFQHNPRFRERALEVGLSQKFPVTNRLSLEKGVTATEVKASEAEVKEVERILTGQARELVIKVLASRQRRALVNSQSEVSGRFAEFLAETVSRGEGSPLDAGQAKLESASLLMEIRQLDAAEAALVGELKPLLGMSPAQSLVVSGTLPDPVVPRGTVDPERRPDFQAAKLNAHAAEQGVALEQAKRYEDVEGSIFAGAERSEDAPDGYDTEAMVGIRLSIPLPLWNKNEGAIQEAQARKTRMEKEAVALSRNIRLEAAGAKSEMVEWLKMIEEINGTLLPLAEKQSELAEESYRNGQGEIQSVLRSREKSLQLAGARLDALREFHLARVRYDSAVANP